MLNLTLTPAERDQILDILKNYQSDFHMEIADTMTPDYRTELKAQQASLASIIERLEKLK